MIHVHELDVLKVTKIWDSFWCKNPDPYKMTRNRIYVYRLYPFFQCVKLKKGSRFDVNTHRETDLITEKNFS